MTETPADALARYAERINQSLTLRHHGFVVTFVERRRVDLVLDPLRPEHRGGLGTGAVNGGVIAAAFDFAIGFTAALVDPTRRSATVEVSLRFERPARGNSMRVEAVIDRASRALLFASALLYDDAGEICARAHGLVALSDKPWADGESPAVN